MQTPISASKILNRQQQGCDPGLRVEGSRGIGHPLGGMGVDDQAFR